MALRADGLRVRRGPLAATFLDVGDDVRTEVGYAVGKQVGSAVVRNRLRRRLRAIVADLAVDPDGGVPPGVLLIRPAPEAVRRSHDELRNDVRSLLEALERRRSTTEAR